SRTAIRGGSGAPSLPGTRLNVQVGMSTAVSTRIPTMLPNQYLRPLVRAVGVAGMAMSQVSKSLLRSDALWYRFFRSFLNALSMISTIRRGTAGLTLDTEAGVRFKIASMITPAALPENAGWPVIIS